MLEYDEEFTNMNVSGIRALANLCLCATKMYIATELRVKIDETEVVGGFEIGIIKTLVEEYAQQADLYDELLTKTRGAMLYDKKMIGRLSYHAL